jgi:hypothetical protein
MLAFYSLCVKVTEILIIYIIHKTDTHKQVTLYNKVHLSSHRRLLIHVLATRNRKNRFG